MEGRRRSASSTTNVQILIQQLIRTLLNQEWKGKDADNLLLTLVHQLNNHRHHPPTQEVHIRFKTSS